MKDRLKLAKYLCSTNVFTEEEKNEIREVAEKHCTGEPHNDQAVLWIYIQKVSKACD